MCSVTNDPIAASKLKEIRKQEESTAFQELMVNTEKRFKQRWEETNEGQRPDPFPCVTYQQPSAGMWSMNMGGDNRS